MIGRGVPSKLFITSLKGCRRDAVMKGIRGTIRYEVELETLIFKHLQEWQLRTTKAMSISNEHCVINYGFVKRNSLTGMHVFFFVYTAANYL